MRLEVAERLRCPAAHTPTPLVVVARETRDRALVTGFAGCPICELEARIEAGHVRFPEPVFDGMMAQGSDLLGPAWTAELERTIALLGLDEPGGAVLLTGRYAPLAGAIASAVDVAVVVMLANELPESNERVAGVTGALAAVPFSDGTFRAAAVDAWGPSALVADAARTVAPQGRMLAPAALRLPPGLKELARDDREWVAAREATSALVGMSRRR